MLIPNNENLTEKYITGVISFTLIFSLVSGIMEYLQKPKNKKKAKKTKNKPHKDVEENNTLTRREKLLGNTRTTRPTTNSGSKSEAIQKLKALRDQPNKQIEVDHSKYKPQ